MIQQMVNYFLVELITYFVGGAVLILGGEAYDWLAKRCSTGKDQRRDEHP